MRDLVITDINPVQDWGEEVKKAHLTSFSSETSRNVAIRL